jgi:hypothetical protein
MVFVFEDAAAEAELRDGTAGLLSALATLWLSRTDINVRRFGAIEAK